MVELRTVWGYGVKLKLEFMLKVNIKSWLNVLSVSLDPLPQSRKLFSKAPFSPALRCYLYFKHIPPHILDLGNQVPSCNGVKFTVKSLKVIFPSLCDFSYESCRTQLWLLQDWRKKQRSSYCFQQGWMRSITSQLEWENNNNKVVLIKSLPASPCITINIMKPEFVFLRFLHWVMAFLWISAIR